MSNRHLIARQVFELRAAIDQADLHCVQDSLSRQYWQSVVPAFEQLFDRLVPTDQLLRVDHIEIDLGRWSLEQMLTRQFVDNLVVQLEVAIADALAGSVNSVQVQPFAAGQFELWLYFLERGSLPAAAVLPDSFTELQSQIVAELGERESAVKGLRLLLSRQPQALQRLLLQHDAEVLMQILARLSGAKHSDLKQLIEQVIKRIVQHHTSLVERVQVVGTGQPHLQSIAEVLCELATSLLTEEGAARTKTALQSHIEQCLTTHSEDPAALASALLSHTFWGKLFAGFARPVGATRLSQQMVAVLLQSTDLRRIAASGVVSTPAPTRPVPDRIRLLVVEALFLQILNWQGKGDLTDVMAAAIHSPVLRPWQSLLGSSPILDESAASNTVDWPQLTQAIDRLQSNLPEPATEALSYWETMGKPDPATGVNTSPDNEPQQDSDCFYVKTAGIILFHPFLLRFFTNLGLYQDGEFVDNLSHQRAVYLLHHLATGEVRTPEYSLVLAKFLCGMPLNRPLDHRLEVNAAERSETETLIETAISHWGALGQCSAQWLRDMFLLRDGKLEKRETGWHLLVERKAQDLLLNKLPYGWGLGMVKLPWMNEFLHIDW